MLQPALSARLQQTLTSSGSRAPTVVPHCNPRTFLRKELGLQPPKQFTGCPACQRRCAASAAVTEVVSTAASTELPSTAEQVAMDEIAADLVAKLDAACARMGPDDVDSATYPLDELHVSETEPMTANAGRTTTRPSGRRRKPQPKEVPADALPKVC